MSCFIIEAGEYVEIEDIRDEVPCKECGKNADQRIWYKAEGSVNRYYSISCSHCGYTETDSDNP